MTQDTHPRFSRDLLTGGPNQCQHGVPDGRAVRPDVLTPACPLCRRQYLALHRPDDAR